MESIGATSTLWYAVATIVGLIVAILFFEKQSRVDGRIAGAETVLADLLEKSNIKEGRLRHLERDVIYLRGQVELLKHMLTPRLVPDLSDHVHLTDSEATHFAIAPGSSDEGQDGGVNG